jgi:hypothetical protein
MAELEGVSLADFIMFAVAEKITRFDVFRQGNATTGPDALFPDPTDCAKPETRLMRWNKLQ